MKPAGFALLSILCLGCSESPPVADVVVADSAGIAITTNGPQQLAAAKEWHLTDVPLLWIRSAEAGVTLFRVTAVARSASGTIAAANRGTNEVLLFDARGNLVGRRGREGDGPGEFRRISSVLWLTDDSLAVYDTSHKRMSVFSPSGDLTGEFTLAPTERGNDFEQIFTLPDGGFAVFSNDGLGGGGPGVFRTMSESFAIDRHGRKIGSFGEFPGAEVFIGRLAGTVPFGARSYAAVVDGELVVGIAERPEVKFHTTEARLNRIVRWPDHHRPVTEARMEEFIAAAEASVPVPARAQVRSMLEELPRSERQPPYEDILATPDGEFWVGEYRGPEMAFDGARSPARQWLVFDKLGVLQARVSTPTGFQPLSLWSHGVIGVFVDEAGVESIQAYQVIRESPEPNGENASTPTSTGPR